MEACCDRTRYELYGNVHALFNFAAALLLKSVTILIRCNVATSSGVFAGGGKNEGISWSGLNQQTMKVRA